MEKNKKAVSLMLSYVLLVTITIGLAIAVFSWLRLIANIEPVVSCEDGTAILITDYDFFYVFSLVLIFFFLLREFYLSHQ